MPKVGKKHYPYTHAGRRAAKEEAKKQDLKVEYTESTYDRIAEAILEGLSPAATQYLATRRAGYGSPKAYGNIPVSPARQSARMVQGSKVPSSEKPEMDWPKLIAAKDKPEQERQAVAGEIKSQHDTDTDRHFRKVQRRDRQYNYSNRPGSQGRRPG